MQNLGAHPPRQEQMCQLLRIRRTTNHCIRGMKCMTLFGKQFDALTAQALQATRQTANIAQVTAQSREETMRLRDFKEAGANGILECKIESIIIPLLADHVLREANHYLCVLGTCDLSD